MLAAPRAITLWAQGQMPAPLTLKVGDIAPDFTLMDNNKQRITLSQFRGKKNVALAFYDFAFTVSSTKHMQNLQQNLAKLESADTQVLGVSMDSPFSNAAWAEKISVTFPLLSDWGGEVTRAYGLYNEKYKIGRRVNFLIDKDGKIIEIQADNEAVDPTHLVTVCENRKK